MTYSKVYYKPEGAKRSSTVILVDPRKSDAFTVGFEVDGEGDLTDRFHLIDNKLVTKRVALVMDFTHGILV